VDRPGPALIRGRFERRAHVRVPVRLEVAYEDASGAVFLRALDLSAGGVWLRAPAPPPPGAPARLVLEIPGEPALLRLRGRVVRGRRAPEAGFAVAFDEAGDSRDLGRFLARRLGWRRAS